MNPLRGDVVLVGLLLSVPVLAMGLRGDFSAEEVAVRVLWCLAAGWGVVTVLRLASTPRPWSPPTLSTRRRPSRRPWRASAPPPSDPASSRPCPQVTRSSTDRSPAARAMT